ncbi:yjeF N-terminal domain-containing 3 [Platichthys flesus]|uniref:yjeF N-terminal domain-containing 3 n=1 Tax=Platichthys flesus TaxID=8260 RepID=UPI002DB81439|nr:yjeF N-terminal domain-containing 3 [Platichthys flesus]
MDKMNHSSAEAEAETIEPLRYLSKEEAAAIETELVRDYRFGQQQLIEIWGQACAIAITKAYPLSSLAKKQPTVLVICGPDQNGSIGLVCARHLRIFEYEPTIYHPKRSSHSLHQDFTVQCEKMDIPSLSYLPQRSLINDAYNLVIDAMLGPESDWSNIKEPYSGILVTLKQVKIPIASVDVPSGWDIEEPSQDGINPDVLISLTAPKKCAMNFTGKHFLAGRFLPYDIQKKYELNLPVYPGTDCLIEL